jgi:MoaE-MoaD fusion protein
MRVRVLLFGMLKDLAGNSSETIDLDDGASVRDVLAHYQVQMPQLRAALPSLAVAVNQQYANPGTKLKENDEVALLPPVSGGAADASGDGSLRLRPALAPTQPRTCLVREPIDAARVLDGLKRGEDGAAVVFEGVVRNQTRGRKTLFLVYEAYEEMALRELESLAEEALRRFAIRDAAMVHRLGRLEIGETSVMVVVVSAHRAAAFDACRWLIDTLKRTVPIWKKEHFEDGAVWADGEPFPAEIQGANSSGQGSPAKDSASK